MKHLFFIILITLSIGVKAQLSTQSYSTLSITKSVEMTATQTTTSIDRKFEEVQRNLTEARQQIKRMNAQESISNSPKLKAEINQLLADLQAVMKLNRPKFMDSKDYKWTGDSLQTVNEKERLSSEIVRLKSIIASGEDSTYIQPQINQIQNRQKDLNKIMKTWKRVK